MALDIGDKRIGVAVTDPIMGIPMPHVTLNREGRSKDIERLIKEAENLGAEEIVCGVPYNFDGSKSAQTEKTLKFISALKERTDIPVKEVDERFTTIQASRILLEADMRRDKRKEVVDKVAASYILEHYINVKKGEQNGR